MAATTAMVVWLLLHQCAKCQHVGVKKDGPWQENEIMKVVMLFLKRDLHGPLRRQDTNGQSPQTSATKELYLKLLRVSSLIWQGEHLDIADC